MMKRRMNDVFVYVIFICKKRFITFLGEWCFKSISLVDFVYIGLYDFP